MTGEIVALVGSLIASAFALVRYAMTQNRSLLDRFVAFLERSGERRESVDAGFQSALERLGENVRENSALLARVAERLGIGSQLCP